ncbi:MAG: AAA family ATPase [Candidatus Nanoarchaeia archaeon]|nr:AAA family ATPase [Candidatus Haiyanarchaeum thermophilum]MCW1303312.1 AAA family ATPase [Candidatus Haiyanarchaeum thermophilum]MCW1304106.1 AAA family ATPase [Candidatus Haiyanarchaeum thermophilum]MCW1307232.1 AAA family ATPase [Candidatus Haiyanarchaeum thermophilum]MCW1308100.1 AAA family ATPase [Candidatus Haiyanarchaeum thermophilum]
MGKVIAFSSIKGGVGKTTCAANFSYLLSSLGYNTLVIDGNLSGANLAMQFGIDLKNANTLHHVMLNRKKVLDAIYLHPKSGLKILPGSIDYELIMKVKAKGLSNTLEKIRDLFDYIILDTPAGINENLLACIEASDEVLGITTQDVASIGETLKLLELCSQLGKEVRGIIINKYNKRFGLLLDQLKKFLGKEIIGVINEDPKVSEATEYLSPVVEIFPRARASRDFNDAVLCYLGMKRKESLVERMFRLFYK